MKNISFYAMLIVILIFCENRVIAEQYYFINTYEQNSNSEYYNIALKSVDLENGLIQESLILEYRGSLLHKVPLILRNENNRFLITLAWNGGYAKNSSMDVRTTYFSVLRGLHNGDLAALLTDSISNADVDYIHQYTGEAGFRISIRDSRNGNPIFNYGLYSISGNFRFAMVDTVSRNNIPGRLYEIFEYDFIQRISWNSERNLFYSFQQDKFKLVKLNNEMNSIMDSLNLQRNSNYLTLFAYHPQRDKIYCFHLNYEIHGKFQEYERSYNDNTEQPEVLLYDGGSLELIETLPIANYPEGNYPGPEDGLAEVVGDFIVYYFFEDDWMGRFNPAMLFIFDTRTNEATWLRVGWR